MDVQVSSLAFEPGGAIPKKRTGEGSDVSPVLTWTGLPEGTKKIALICDDPDAPTPKPWVHWVVYKIPADLTGLPEGSARSPRRRKRFRQDGLRRPHAPLRQPVRPARLRGGGLVRGRNDSLSGRGTHTDTMSVDYADFKRLVEPTVAEFARRD